MLYQFYRLYRIIALDGIISFFFLSVTLYLLCGPKNDRLRLIPYALWGTCSFIALYTGVVLLVFHGTVLTSGDGSPYWYYFLCTVLISLLWAHFQLKAPLLSKLIYILFFVALVQLYKIVCLPLYQLEGIMPKEQYAALDLLTACIMYTMFFLLACLFKRYKISATVHLSTSATFFMLYFPASLLLGIILSVSFATDYIGPILSVVILTNIPVIYYLLSRIITTYEERRRMDAALAQSQAELAGYQRAADLQKQLRKERHELKNKYFYIQSLLREGRYGQLDDYVSEVIGGVSAALSDVETGNTFLDYLLNNKLQQARQAGIKADAEVALPSQLHIDEQAVCTILSNLLDNAIEASGSEAEPEIRITLKCVKGYLMYRISNRVSRDVLALNPQLQTTKPDAENHGFGMKVIDQAVRQCNGIFQAEVTGGYFVAKVMLPFT